MARGLAEMELATADTLTADYKAAREHIEAAVINEKDTLETVNELAADKARVAAHVAALQKAADLAGAAQLAAVDAQMKALAARLKVAPVVLAPTELERAASAMVPLAVSSLVENSVTCRPSRSESSLPPSR